MIALDEYKEVIDLAKSKGYTAFFLVHLNAQMYHVDLAAIELWLFDEHKVVVDPDKIFMDLIDNDSKMKEFIELFKKKISKL